MIKILISIQSLSDVVPNDLSNTKLFLAAGYLFELGNIFEKVVLFT